MAGPVDCQQQLHLDLVAEKQAHNLSSSKYIGMIVPPQGNPRYPKVSQGREFWSLVYKLMVSDQLSAAIPASCQVAAHRVRTDEGLALPTNAGRRNFAVNRISEELPVCIKLGEVGGPMELGKSAIFWGAILKMKRN